MPPQKIQVERIDGTLHTYSEATPVATFNNGFSHFIVEDHCYLLVNGGKVSPYIFPEALEVLKTLPRPE